jgi:hypothetical protein
MKTPAERMPAEIEVVLHNRFASILAAGGAPRRVSRLEVEQRRIRIFVSGALLEGEVRRIAVPWLVLGRIEYVGYRGAMSNQMWATEAVTILWELVLENPYGVKIGI